MPTRFKQLERLLQSSVEGKSAQYESIHIDEFCVIFGPTPNTGKVMIPTD